ncbi:MAG TPA: flagellar basal body rod C-terminal domain-containing protein [Bryobacteraceae bacterium]|nr:flagellar basal body rod C-terminal domain-containing protein [Bryobacteraceae bacterium]
MQIVSAALSGLQRAETLVNQSAAQLAQASLSASGQVSLSDSAVTLLAAKNGYQANLDSIKVADEMQKSTLSLLA